MRAMLFHTVPSGHSHPGRHIAIQTGLGTSQVLLHPPHWFQTMLLFGHSVGSGFGGAVES